MNYTLLGKKIGMTQVYDESNALVPVTVIEAGPCSVVQVKSVETDGYHAVQIGFGARKEGRTTKPISGHFAKAGAGNLHTLREVRCDEPATQNPGDVLTVSGFNPGDTVDIIGETKGRGFQGVVKRYRFAGGPASHGSMSHRRGGSYGMSQDPGHTFKNKKMPGHMGSVRRTVQNLLVVQVLEDRNLILVRGSVPGANGSTVVVRSSVKRKRSA